MRKLLLFLKYGTYPFLGVSLLLFMGMAFGSAFVTDFTIQNHTGEAIVVTPVGTFGAGTRAPLPVKAMAFPALPAHRCGGYRLAPGESVRIQYDMDDINFSEIVVTSRTGPPLQLVTDPNPTANQYHAPRQRHYIIDNLARLQPASPLVQQAAHAAIRQSGDGYLLVSLLFGPWFAYAIVACLSHLWGHRERPHESPSQVS